MKRRSLFQILGLIPAISLAGISVAVISDVVTIQDQLNKFDIEDQVTLQTLLKEQNIPLDEECLTPLALLYRINVKNISDDKNEWKHNWDSHFCDKAYRLQRIYYKYTYPSRLVNEY